VRLQHLAVLVLCVSGCADTQETAVDSGSDAGTLPASGIDLSGIVSQRSGPALNTRLEGVEVCQDGVPNCAMTDANGWFALGGIMPETEILLVYRKDGFVPSLQPVVAPRWSSEFPVFSLLRRDDTLAAGNTTNVVLRAAVRPELDVSDEGLDRLSIILFAAASGYSVMGITDEVRVELDPNSGGGPFFFLGNGNTVLEVPTGQPVVAGSFTNVEPRDDGYELVYQHLHGECRQTSNAGGGWPSASGRRNATRVPARAGYITFAWQACKSADAGTGSDAGQR